MALYDTGLNFVPEPAPEQWPALFAEAIRERDEARAAVLAALRHLRTAGRPEDAEVIARLAEVASSIRL